MSGNQARLPYENQIPTPMAMGLRPLLSMMKDYWRGRSQLRPAKTLPVVPVTADAKPDGGARAVWFGHSASLVEIEGKRLLLDPMLAPASSPFPVFSSRRYSGSPPVTPEAFGEIDAVLLSHNHYDHLDRRTVLKLKDKVKMFHVPSGVGRYLAKWGIPPERIAEHGWWDEFEYEGLTIACTPARHFSGRGMSDRNRSLWCSWVILGERHRLFFSGDSGYAPHFREIGEKYGPFDLALMECGQYDERWSNIHMMPEETVQAHLDVKGGVLVPIHWGAFTLALHAWSDPIERVTKAAKRRGVVIATPRLGEPVPVGAAAKLPAEAWWRTV